MAYLKRQFNHFEAGSPFLEAARTLKEHLTHDFIIKNNFSFSENTVWMLGSLAKLREIEAPSEEMKLWKDMNCSFGQFCHC